MKTTRLAALIACVMLTLAACGGGSEGTTTTADGSNAPGAGDPVAGAEVYKGTCSACHGPALEGIDGLGKALAPNNEFVSGSTEEELVGFIQVGRPAGDPANDTGVDMPPRGGNPALSDQDLANVAAYIKAQNG